jgi:hypothetical protein
MMATAPQMTNIRRKRIHQADGTPTLIIGIVLTVLGGGLLIEKLTGFPIWSYVWKLWPVLLIIMGIKDLVKYYRNRREQEEAG